jgi:hypothetical protein
MKLINQVRDVIRKNIIRFALNKPILNGLSDLYYSIVSVIKKIWKKRKFEIKGTPYLFLSQKMIERAYLI